MGQWLKHEKALTILGTVQQNIHHTVYSNRPLRAPRKVRVNLIFTPGPDVMYITTRGIAQGRRAALVSTLGVCGIHRSYALGSVRTHCAPVCLRNTFHAREICRRGLFAVSRNQDHPKQIPNRAENRQIADEQPANVFDRNGDKRAQSQRNTLVLFVFSAVCGARSRERDTSAFCHWNTLYRDVRSGVWDVRLLLWGNWRAVIVRTAHRDGNEMAHRKCVCWTRRAIGTAGKEIAPFRADSICVPKRTQHAHAVRPPSAREIVRFLRASPSALAAAECQFVGRHISLVHDDRLWYLIDAQRRNRL